jgi:Flagellar basal body rod protein
MFRAPWTLASGMIAQQTNLDVIAHNMANVNTMGFKKRSWKEG